MLSPVAKSESAIRRRRHRTRSKQHHLKVNTPTNLTPFPPITLSITSKFHPPNNVHGNRSLSLSLYVFIFPSRLRFMHNAPTNVDIIARDATRSSALYTHSSYVHLWICWCGKCGESMDRIPLEKSEGCLLLNLWLEGRTTYRLGFCGLCVCLCHLGRACVASNLQLGI